MSPAARPSVDEHNGGARRPGRSADEIAAGMETWLVGDTTADAGERAARKPSLEKLIAEGLEANYIESCKDQIETGNHYQSVSLGTTTSLGFRASRERVLDLIDCRGATVLDLGSNLGELSRGARRRGATANKWLHTHLWDEVIEQQMASARAKRRPARSQECPRDD